MHRVFPCLAVLLGAAAGARAQDLGDEPASSPAPLRDELRSIRARLDALEAGGASTEPQGSGYVDLSGDELPSIEASGSDHVLARPWYENIELHGYGAFTYLDSGGTGTSPDGSFLVKEATLFLEAEVWEDVSFFSETWIKRYKYDYGDEFTVGELYVAFSRLFAGDDGRGIGLKAGRVDIPFGEDYLRQDATDNPLITQGAADPYGVDEGLVLYGHAGPVGWVTSLTNGPKGFREDDDPSKQVSLKLYGEPAPALYLSASALKTGDTDESAIKISSLYFTPVGFDGVVSSAGTSPSARVDTTMYEVDARIHGERWGQCALQFGQAFVDDDASGFDRDLTWFQIEPRVRVADELEVILRYSEVGTYDSDEGYLLSGKIVADGDDFGYDTSSLKRASAGLLWTINQRMAAKLEVGHDWIELIDASPFDEENDERLFFGLEIVASF
jgi:hypothetical protein